MPYCLVTPKPQGRTVRGAVLGSCVESCQLPIAPPPGGGLLELGLGVRVCDAAQNHLKSRTHRGAPTPSTPTPAAVHPRAPNPSRACGAPGAPFHSLRTAAPRPRPPPIRLVVLPLGGLWVVWALGLSASAQKVSARQQTRVCARARARACVCVCVCDAHSFPPKQ